MLRSSRLVQLFGLAAIGILLGMAAQAVFGPPSERSAEPPRSFSVPLESPADVASPDRDLRPGGATR